MFLYKSFTGLTIICKQIIVVGSFDFAQDDVLGAFLIKMLWRETFYFYIISYKNSWSLVTVHVKPLNKGTSFIRHLDQRGEISYFCFSKSKCIEDISNEKYYNQNYFTISKKQGTSLLFRLSLGVCDCLSINKVF